MDMWQGKILYYGPPSSVGGFGIFPYYYYLNFVFSTFGPNPVYQALSNAIFSFLSIPLLGLTLFRLIEGEVVELKLFFSSIGSFIWSLMAVDIFFSNQEWNPNSIPFFILSFSLIIDLLGKSNKKYLKTVYSILLSFITIYLLSLHSTTLFIMPIALLLSLLVLFTKKMISSFEIFVVFISCVLLSIPYLFGEIPNQFSNTKIILKTIFKTGGEPKTLFSRLEPVSKYIF